MNEAFFAIQEFRLDEDWRLCCFAAFLEWAQLALFILDPVWGWGFRWDTGCVPVEARWASCLECNIAQEVAGQRFFEAKARSLCHRPAPLSVCSPWRWVRRLQLQVPVADQGHTFWTGVLFSIGGIIALIIGGSLFVATRRRTRKARIEAHMPARRSCSRRRALFTSNNPKSLRSAVLTFRSLFS